MTRVDYWLSGGEAMNSVTGDLYRSRRDAESAGVAPGLVVELLGPHAAVEVIANTLAEAKRRG